MAFRCLFHIHTNYSFDSLLSPKRILSRARELHVGAMVVADHNTIKGSLAARELAHSQDPIVPIAAEYQSEKGDIIGLFLKSEICSHQSNEIIQQIHAQGGLAVLPHPFKGHKLDEALLSGVDVIEIYNARCSTQDNERASELARKWRLPTIAGADAHCFAELGAALNEYSGAVPSNELELRQLLLRDNRTLTTQPVSPLCEPYSQMIKALKTGQPALFVYQTKRMVLTLARGGR